ncbi:hypothetical protein BAUCODRAFT_23006 [Baudoinia panamericana UAMH 10762]|uniref:Major facilitator superfamily (MFS) profile domain-containing protein n=1 Tax=Baudoinia panamericana (strain UAMH 10762) TaxID=717646 RepID=M2NGQ8_BAUPA|nr:uncharacterized protein BAUCODRAFT_23006 [Baudoinia panamericana UAMH 10762]EMC98190.1 hypothetical protein BAUCODRAFT_23006 [Baudoinia panamericana UAMH 10762]
MGKYIPNFFNLLVVVYVALGSTACSYGLAILGSTIGQPSFYKSLDLAAQGEPGYGRTASLIGAFNGVGAAGACLGAIFTSWSADALSRKHTIQIGAIILSIGAALCASSVNSGMLIFARLFAGVGIGTLITCIPMYQAEVSTPESRGFMVSMHGIMFAVGYGLSSWIGFGVYFISASGSKSTFPWRFPLAFQAVPALIMLAGSPWLPYSPRWLMMKDRYEEAEAILKRLHARKGEDNHQTAIKEFYQMKKQLEHDRQVKATISRFEVFKTAPNRKRVYVVASMMWFNMFTGVLILANYAVFVFQQLGISGYMPLLLLAIWITISFPGNVVTALFVDRLGRRGFMLVGACGILVSLILECVLQALYDDSTNRAGGRAAIFPVFLFIVFWSSCFDATQYLYMSEIFPTAIRGQGTAVGMFNQ